MKTYEKDGQIFEVFCGCDKSKGKLSEYPSEGEWDSVCPKCFYYYHYYPSLPLDIGAVTEPENCDNDTVEYVEEEYAYTCGECGEECHEVTDTEEGEVCSGCLSDKFIFCKECGSLQYSEDSHLYEGGRICSSCYDDSYFTCEKCGEVHHIEESCSVYTRSRWRGEEQWCEDCVGNYAYQCDDCEDIFTNNELEYVGDRCLCYNCGESYLSCEDCGAVIHHDYSYYSDEDDCNYCGSCYSDNKNNNNYIKDYNYKPRPQFHGKGLHLGVELEMECKDRSDTAEALLTFSDDEDLFYIKSDGSLNNGIELVTHPCSLAYHKEDFGWSDVLKKAVSEGARSHDTSTCGIHVHLSRRFFTTTEVTRFVAFVNVHGDHLKVLARRGASDYSRFKYKHNGTKRLVQQEERYEAVNLYNRNTLEVRIFKGTLKESTLMACIEICDAMARFTKTSNISSIIGKSEENWEQFLNYVQNNLKVYNYLYSFMQSKGMIPVLPPAPVVYLEDPPEEIKLEEIKLEDTIFGVPAVVPEFPWEFEALPRTNVFGSSCSLLFAA